MSKEPETEKLARAILDFEIAEATRRYDARIARIRAREALEAAALMAVGRKLENGLSKRANRVLREAFGASFSFDDVAKANSRGELSRLPGSGWVTATEIKAWLKGA